MFEVPYDLKIHQIQTNMHIYDDLNLFLEVVGVLQLHKGKAGANQNFQETRFEVGDGDIFFYLYMYYSMMLCSIIYVMYYKNKYEMTSCK